MPELLIDQKWYVLPNGRRVIASTASERDDDGGTPTGGYVLYDEEEWEHTEIAAHEAQPDGRITLWGADTGWTTSDLYPV